MFWLYITLGLALGVGSVIFAISFLISLSKEAESEIGSRPPIVDNCEGKALGTYFNVPAAPRIKIKNLGKYSAKNLPPGGRGSPEPRPTKWDAPPPFLEKENMPGDDFIPTPGG